MGFINFRGGQKADNFEKISEQAKQAEAAEQEALGSIRRRRIAADYFGVSELAEKDNKTILFKLISQQKALVEVHNSLVSGNELIKYFDDSQLFKDLWLASIAEILDQGRLSDIQKTKGMQLLLTAFQVNNQTKSTDHYLYMVRNEQYKNYMNRCFGLGNVSMPGFWLWLEHLGNQELEGVGQHNRNRMDTVLFFLNEYMNFMMTLSFYITQMFPGAGCGKDTKQLLQEKISIMSQEMTRKDFMQINLSGLVNPIYGNPEDLQGGYSGYEQSYNQSQGLKGAFDELKGKFGKNKRVVQIVQLLDMCSDSDVKVLENEYKRMTRLF